jgi:hypothetical protein
VGSDGFEPGVPSGPGRALNAVPRTLADKLRFERGRPFGLGALHHTCVGECGASVDVLSVSEKKELYPSSVYCNNCNIGSHLVLRAYSI